MRWAGPLRRGGNSGSIEGNRPYGPCDFWEVRVAEQLGPFEIAAGDREVVIKFMNPDELWLEVPPSLKDQLAGWVGQHRDELVDRKIVVDLVDQPGLSSRHLGMLLALRQELESFSPLWIRRASAGIGQLLELTKMARFFEFEDE